ncbi:MAG: tRNA lysidine(34) synthetase TilS [Chloroflexaceae bacterium]
MSTDLLLDRVRTALDDQHLLRQEARVVVAVSGGPDSLCLLHLLWRLQAEGGPALHVAHLDHGFRGAQSAAEARFVAQTAAAWGLPATVEQADLPTIVRTTGQNRQAAARQVRYAFLARVARSIRAAAVAVAHQADDQAETVLLHLLYGAGPAGLRGMRALVPWQEWHNLEGAVSGVGLEPPPPTAAASASAPWLIRPLLTTTRAEIEHYCNEHALTPQYDPSNTAPYSMRSRIRMEILPYLATYNQQIVTALTRTAQICADDYAYLQTELDTRWPDLVEALPGAICFQRAAWQQLPVALQRYALRRAALQLDPGAALSYEQIEAGRAATNRTSGYQQTLAHGLMMRIEATSFVLFDLRSGATHPSPEPTLPQLETDECRLRIPGRTPLSPSWQAETSWTAPESLPAEARWRWWVALDADICDGPLLFRHRRAGDRFRPVGAPGSRRLQDFFVDQKLPRELRAAWPILATPTAIVWVAGLRADGRFQATTHTTRTLWVTLVRVQPPIGKP